MTIETAEETKNKTGLYSYNGELKSYSYSWKLKEVEGKLEKVTKQCIKLEEQVKLLNKTIDYMSKGKVLIKVSDEEYRLPDTLDKSITALKQLHGTGSASDVSLITNRNRAVESHYLCILENFGIVTSYKIGKIKKFKIKIES